MHLRNQVNQEQLLFDLDINKTLRQIRQRKKREQKIRAAEKNSGAIMAEENHERENHQPRRILGDYALQQGHIYFSSIAISNTARAIEMKPVYLTLISSHQFHGIGS